MNHCETCKYWEHWNSEREFKMGMGTCKMAVMFWDATEWGNNERVIAPEYAHLKAFVQDGSDYSASLYTKRDFGCVSHEARK